MEFTKFVRKPFVVEGVLVTTENIEEIAKDVGTLQYKEDGTPFIVVDRKKVPGVWNVYPGFIMTRNGSKIRCFSRRSFAEQFCDSTPDIEAWVDYINKENVTIPTSAAPTPPTLGEFSSLVEVPQPEGVSEHAEASN